MGLIFSDTHDTHDIENQLQTKSKLNVDRLLKEIINNTLDEDLLSDLQLLQQFIIQERLSIKNQRLNR